MATLVKPSIKGSESDGKYRYIGSGSGGDTVHCRWYWIEVTVGGNTYQPGPSDQVHSEGHHKTLPLPSPGGGSGGRKHKTGKVSLKSSPKQGQFSGGGVTVEATEEVDVTW